MEITKADHTIYASVKAMNSRIRLILDFKALTKDIILHSSISDYVDTNVL